jgi:putative ABC transport system permease protein
MSYVLPLKSLKEMNIKLPQRSLKFLRWFCREDYLDEIEGDLLEIYKMEFESSPRKAKWKFTCSVFKYFRPEFIKSFGHQSNAYGMYKSYFKIGWRNLLRYKGYSLINIGGLAIGMMVAILNGLWIWDELSFNKYFQGYDRTAQVAISGVDNGESWVGTTMTYPLGTELITNHHEYFKHVVRTAGGREYILSTEDKNLSCQGLFADEDAPELFTFKMIYGSRNGLGEAHSIVISNSFSKALFGDVDPVGKSIRINNKIDVIIGGVYEDFPFNTQFYNVKFFGNWSLFLLDNPWIEPNNWRSHFIEIYVEIIPETNFQLVSERLKNIIQTDPRDAEKFAQQKREFLLYPMSDWHLFPYDRGKVNQEPMRMIWMVGMIGAFVLVLACINFMNLSTARSEKRAKEVGIRKTIGSVRLQLISQFFCESVLVVVFASTVSLVLVNTFLPWFNQVAGKQIEIPWMNTTFWMCSIGFILITSIVAGSYPALYLSSLNPVKALKGAFRVGRMASLPRKILVVIQFSISVILIISTIVVYQQIQFAKNRPVGYSREGLITIRKKTSDFFGKFDVLRSELLNTNVVEDMVTQSLYRSNKQTVFVLNPFDQVNFISVRISPQASPDEALTKLGQIFVKHNPSTPFEYKFADDEFAEKFAFEQRVGRLVTIFAVLAIFISCLGLFGLASFVAEQRTKEIGIRKVMGASISGLWRLLSKDFLILVIIACFIAMPVANYLMHGWLSSYDYRTEISWWVFLITGGSVLLITLLTVSYQTVKAALMNPVNSLKSE